MNSKYAITVSLFILSFFQSYGQQCFPGGFFFSTQSEIDDFSTIAPGCTEIIGDVFIIGDITNLDGLAQLNSFGGELLIDGTSLVDLGGLENITSIGTTFFITMNQSLENVDALSQLNSVGGMLFISDNSAIESLAGLQSVATIGDNLDISNSPLLTDIGFESLTSVGGYLNISINPLLTDISKLSTLTQIGGMLYLDRNTTLTSLNGLQNIDPTSIANSSDPKITFIDNDVLSFCSVQSICDALDLPAITFDVQGNAEGCNTELEIEVACTTLALPKIVRFDVLQNGSSHTISVELRNLLDLDRIEIQSSQDGIDYETIYTIERSYFDSFKGVYTYNRLDTRQGNIYYRLKMLDLNGDYDYSNTKHIRDKKSSFQIYPNPVTDYIVAQTSGEKEELKVYDAMGSMVLHTNLYTGKNRFDVTGLVSGLYYYTTSSNICGKFSKY